MGITLATTPEEGPEQPRRAATWRVLAPFLASFLVVTWGTRLILAAMAWKDLVLGGALPGLVARALVLDLVTAGYLLALPALLLALVPRRVVRGPWNHPALEVAYIVWLYGLCCFGAVEVVFWNEFGCRLNFIAVDYLVYTQEVLGNMVESFPMAKILLGLLALTLLVAWRTRGGLRGPDPDEGAGSRGLVVAVALMVPLVGATFVSDTLSRGSANRYACELARNGVHSFFAAYRKNHLEYAAFYPTRPEQAVRALLRRLVDPDGTAAFEPGAWVARRVTSDGERRWNLVIVLVESLGAEFLGSFGCPLGLTPKLDALRHQGRMYTRMFASGTRTVRGLEAVTLSLPPTPGNSLVRQPNNELLGSIAWPLRARGYTSRFLYGGFGYFDNMNYFCSHNGFDVVDRSDMAASEVHFANVWGVCDEDLLDRSLREADSDHAAGKPFFQLVLTTSNHRPYTYPEAPGVPQTGDRAGAVRYTDHALGRYLEQAATHPWFRDTLFVVLGDHGASSAGRIEVPVYRYHIPCLVYAPALVPPGDDPQLASQIDLAPTLLGMLGVGYRSTFLGVDLNRHHPGRALVSTYESLGLYRADRLTVLRPRGRPEGWSVADSWLPEPRDVDPEDLEDTIAYYQGAAAARAAGELQLRGEPPGPPVTFRW